MPVSKPTRVTLLAGIVGMLLGANMHAQNPVRGTDSASAPVAAPLPKDIDPDSRYRLPLRNAKTWMITARAFSTN
jgi:hypothetical protein